MLGHVVAEVLLFTAGVTAMLPARLFGYRSDELILAAMIGIGVTQMIYAIPICCWCSYRRQFETLKGVVIGMVLTVLLNGACYLRLLSTGP